MKSIYTNTTSTTTFAIVEMAGQGVNHRDRWTLASIEVPAEAYAAIDWSKLRRLAAIPGCKVIGRCQILRAKSVFHDPLTSLAKVQQRLDASAEERRRQETGHAGFTLSVGGQYA
ncbi:hypothetical protein [Pseudoxanthomonas mexicana]